MRLACPPSASPHHWFRDHHQCHHHCHKPIAAPTWQVCCPVCICCHDEVIDKTTFIHLKEGYVEPTPEAIKSATMERA